MIPHIPEVMAQLETYARESGCGALTADTRSFVVRVMKDHGYEEIYRTIQKDLRN